jgi:hypothetical protein
VLTSERGRGRHLLEPRLVAVRRAAAVALRRAVAVLAVIHERPASGAQHQVQGPGWNLAEIPVAL